MNDRLLLTGLLMGWSLGIGCAPEYPPPPPTERGTVVDTIHGVDIPDPYRWLEDQASGKTRAWIDGQNAYAEQIIGETPLRERLRVRFRELMDVPDIGDLRRGGDLEYFTLRRSGQELSVIARREAPPEGELQKIDPGAEYEVVIDPHDMSPHQTTKVDILSVSDDGGLLLYSVRDGGQDEIEVRLRDLETGEDLPEVLPNALYGNIFFARGGDGFYYTARSRQTGPRVRFHVLGTELADDVEIFGEGIGPRSFIQSSEIAEGKYLLLGVRHGWARSEIHVLDQEQNEIRAIVKDVDGRFATRFIEGELYVGTNLEAPNDQIFAIDLENPARAHWRVVVPEAEDAIQGFTEIDAKLYVTYLHDVSARIRVFELDGTPAGEVAVPEHHNASIRGASEGKAFLTLVSFTQPAVTYLLDLASGERESGKSRRSISTRAASS